MFKKAKLIGAAVLFFIAGQQKASAQLPIIGKSFFALTVKNADSVANWYTSTFDLKSIKEINDAAAGVVVKIIGNDNMVIEILQMKNSKPAKDWGMNDNFQMHGFVKVGFFVGSMEMVQQHLTRNNIKIKYGPFADKETQTKNLIISDNEGNLIQFFEDIK